MLPSRSIRDKVKHFTERPAADLDNSELFRNSTASVDFELRVNTPSEPWLTVKQIEGPDKSLRVKVQLATTGTTVSERWEGEFAVVPASLAWTMQVLKALSIETNGRLSGAQMHILLRAVVRLMANPQEQGYSVYAVKRPLENPTQSRVKYPRTDAGPGTLYEPKPKSKPEPSFFEAHAAIYEPKSKPKPEPSFFEAHAAIYEPQPEAMDYHAIDYDEDLMTLHRP